MTANGLTIMFLGEKKNRASKTALPNLSFSRAVCLPFAIILLCDRVETNSIKPVSQGKVTGQKPCIHAGLRRFDAHSHSQSSICFVVLSSCFSFETVHFRTVLYVFAMFLSDCIVILLSAICYTLKSTNNLKYYNIHKALPFPYKLGFIQFLLCCFAMLF